MCPESLAKAHGTPSQYKSPLMHHAFSTKKLNSKVNLGGVYQSEGLDAVFDRGMGRCNGGRFEG